MAGVDVSPGGRAWLYSPGVQREPLDQTDLKDGVDATLGGGGGSFWKLIGRGHCERSGGTTVGPVSPMLTVVNYNHKPSTKHE
jgi:hypothetical protein